MSTAKRGDGKLTGAAMARVVVRCRFVFVMT